jgi:8-hydroxy-5-deazaflavin:NADPH oxidoreductase
MKIGVLGTGTVGRTLATGLVRLGHQVTMGSRTKGNENAVAWAEEAGGAESDFAGAAADAELVVNATKGAGSLAALEQAGNLEGKIVLDVSNPLEPTGGMARLAVCNDDSLAEQIQRAHPEARVVKSLNTVTASVMTNPAGLPAPTTMFMAGDDESAKAEVRRLLEGFGWQEVLDLGDIMAARGMEMYVALWLRLWGATGTPRLNVRLVR